MPEDPRQWAVFVRDGEGDKWRFYASGDTETKERAKANAKEANLEYAVMVLPVKAHG